MGQLNDQFREGEVEGPDGYMMLRLIRGDE